MIFHAEGSNLFLVQKMLANKSLLPGYSPHEAIGGSRVAALVGLKL